MTELLDALGKRSEIKFPFFINTSNTIDDYLYRLARRPPLKLYLDLRKPAIRLSAPSFPSARARAASVCPTTPKRPRRTTHRNENHGRQQASTGRCRNTSCGH